MKNWIKVLSLSLACMLCMGAVGCKDNKDVETSEPESYKEKYEKVTFDNGRHVYTATETNKPFIKNGATEYILVVPEKASEKIKKSNE